ncbi:exported hypothetical protein [Candidatus Zixiibacteriota bacterium]|nr:exported hypothetical protein [candidate division Zixibacteria bacterium]
MKYLWLGTAILFLAGLIPVAHADVTIKKTMSFEGMMGMGGNVTEETEYIKANMSCSDKTNKTTGGMMGKKAKESKDVQITRLDKGLIWNLDIAKKTYTEMPLQSIKDMMDQAKDAPDMPENEEPSESDDYEWTTDIKTVEGTKDINGFPCHGIIGTAIGINKRDPSDKMRITYEFWGTDKVPGNQELDDYYKAYAKSLGVDEFQSQQAMDQMTRKYSSQFGGIFTDKMKTAGGFPIKVTMKVEKSGGGDQEGNEAAAKAMAKMSGLFGGKKGAEKSADGMMTMFSTDTEVIGVEAGSIPDSKFEVPADYKKK